ncbi:MAG TPA: response regulator transcription factor [Pyrinomonadaceae bacterium]|jgi:DNA-binding NarL/FixJ family response regulator
MTAVAETIRVLIVDDHKIIRDGLRDLISSRQGMTVVGDAGNRADALSAATREHPDIIVLDLDLGDDSGLDLIPELRRADEEVGIIILTGVRDTEKRDRAIELGARGVVLKDEGAAELLSAIEKVHRTEEYWLEPGATKRLLGKRRSSADRMPDPEAAKIAKLTGREREIIALVGEGLENKEIAERLRPVVAESTVRNNLSIIYDKLSIQGGRLGLLVYAYKHRLIPSGHGTL